MGWVLEASQLRTEANRVPDCTHKDRQYARRRVFACWKSIHFASEL